MMPVRGAAQLKTHVMPARGAAQLKMRVTPTRRAQAKVRARPETLTRRVDKNCGVLRVKCKYL